MLKRKAYSQMEKWKASPSKRALLVTGARQVGKTYLVREFARHNYKNFAEINFLLTPEATSIFDAIRTPQELLLRLSIATGAHVEPGRTLFFLDEIQAAPEALTSIKGLIDQGGYDFILSGSLLGVELRNIRSNPVGYITTLKMFPLDFEEFCWARGVDASIFEYLRGQMNRLEAIDGVLDARLNELFRQYLVVGGMPDAVNTLIESDSLSMVRDVQESVKDWYRADISKYCPDSQKLKVKEAYDLVPAELNNPNKRFILKKLDENARFRSYEDAFLWLSNADVALAAYNVDEPATPLLASKSRNLFKLFYSDVGLLTSTFSRKAALDILDGTGEINHGSTYENAVAQELHTHGFSLYYYNNKRLGEVDFVVEDRDGEVIPIEVKSGKGYRRHRAIDNILEVANYHLKTGYVLGPGNVERQNNLVYLPIYMVCLFNNR